MDLYSAAKRLNRPFRFERRDPHLTMPIGAHGLIGDGFSSRGSSTFSVTPG